MYDMMRYTDLVHNWREYASQNPNQRSGQAAFNSVFIDEPEIANAIRATDFDPFYRDDLLPEFWMRVYSLMYFGEDGEGA